MKAVADLFLPARHWQIFLLLCALPVVAETAAIGFVPDAIQSWHDVGPAAYIVAGILELWALSFLAWLGSMGLLFLSLIEAPELRMSTLRFRLALVYAAIYMVLFVPVFMSDAIVPVALIVPLHLLCMICLFYILYFVSKNLALAEIGQPVSFYEYAGPFFLLWFFPIGVWILQPKINRFFLKNPPISSF